MSENKKIAGTKAIVCGGGISGLLAARVLSDHFESVQIIDQEENPPQRGIRKFAPQGPHVHLILKSGANIMEELYPGFFREMEELGSQVSNYCSTFPWFLNSMWMPRHNCDVDVHLQTRPLLEWNLYRRTAELKNVHFTFGTKVLGFLSGDNGKSVKGVKLSNSSGQENEEFAELIVEAGGRNGRIMEALKEIHAPVPEEEFVESYPGYTSVHVDKVDKKGDNWNFLVIFPHIPRTSRAGFILNVEKNGWHVAVGGNKVKESINDWESFLQYAKKLDDPTIYDAIRESKPISDFYNIRIPAYRRRYFEKINNPLEGLIVVGDAFCVVNPIYGQGMMLAALENKILGEIIEKRMKSGRGLKGLPKEYYRGASGWIHNAWTFLTTFDLSYPEFSKRRTATLRFLYWYVSLYLKKCAKDTKLMWYFIQVVHFRFRATILLRPDLMFRTLFG